MILKNIWLKAKIGYKGENINALSLILRAPRVRWCSFERVVRAGPPPAGPPQPRPGSRTAGPGRTRTGSPRKELGQPEPRV